jgi:hypothetical protein
MSKILFFASATEPVTTLTTGGWVSMLVSVGSVCAFFFWCLYRVMREK